MRLRACATCDYWDPVAPTSTRGLCRYAAPRSHMTGDSGDEVTVVAIWPVTNDTDWCGRYEPNQDVRQDD